MTINLVNLVRIDFRVRITRKYVEWVGKRVNRVDIFAEPLEGLIFCTFPAHQKLILLETLTIQTHSGCCMLLADQTAP